MPDFIAHVAPLLETLRALDAGAEELVPCTDPPPTEDEVAAAESALGLVFPHDYRRLLLEFGGWAFEVFPTYWFCGMRRGVAVEQQELVRRTGEIRDEWGLGRHFLPIGLESHFGLFLDLRHPSKGCPVVAFAYQQGDIHEVAAASFADLVIRTLVFAIENHGKEVDRTVPGDAPTGNWPALPIPAAEPFRGHRSVEIAIDATPPATVLEWLREIYDEVSLVGSKPAMNSTQYVGRAHGVDHPFYLSGDESTTVFGQRRCLRRWADAEAVVAAAEERFPGVEVSLLSDEPDWDADVVE